MNCLLLEGTGARGYCSIDTFPFKQFAKVALDLGSDEFASCVCSELFRQVLQQLDSFKAE